MSASGLVGPGQAAGITMTAADIEEVVNAYAQRATDAQRLGFDGVELHAAHGYLIDQFFWSGTNIREDGYGGSIACRTRFGVEIVKEIRRRVGPAFPICLRYSQWKLPDYKAQLAKSPQELEEFLGPLVLAGVDIFHCSVRRFWDPAFEGSDDTLAAWTKKLSGKVVITVGSLGLAHEFIPGNSRNSDPMGIERLAEIFEKGAFDLAAVGRIVLANPDWANKMRSGALQELRSFVPSTIRSYANPTVAHELL